MHTYTISDTPEALSLDFDALPGRIDVLAGDASLEEAWALVECDEEGKAALEAAGLSLDLAKPRRYCDSGGGDTVVLTTGGEGIDGAALRGEYGDDAEEAIRCLANANGGTVVEAPGGGWDAFPAGVQVGWFVSGKFVRASTIPSLASISVHPFNHSACDQAYCGTCREVYKDAATCPECGADLRPSIADHRQACEGQYVEDILRDLVAPEFPTW